MEILYWVGCAPAFDPRAREIARAIVSVLQKAKVEFAILGKEERCTGDLARRAGDEALFQELAVHNINTLHEHRVK
ncbi:(Fe-S)-binding protein, partial [Microbacteriaceae bacterium K1510]|nr:(Fe-S)-binding protein [Microbacteriaceae bacterium K1510]